MRTFRILGPSMEPVIPTGSFVRVSPLSYLWRAPRRDEIVALRAPGAERLDLKRVVALPGERVCWKEADIRVGGAAAAEDEHTLTLKRDEYFVAGDNRFYSQDSRTYGPVSGRNILGRVLGKKNPLARHTYV